MVCITGVGEMGLDMAPWSRNCALLCARAGKGDRSVPCTIQKARKTKDIKTVVPFHSLSSALNILSIVSAALPTLYE
jgi:hypothetical protein